MEVKIPEVVESITQPITGEQLLSVLSKMSPEILKFPLSYILNPFHPAVPCHLLLVDEKGKRFLLG